MREKKRQDTFIYKVIFAVCLLLFSVCAFQYVARADVYLLNGSSARLFVGETITVSDYFLPEEADKILPESLQYAVSDESENAGSVALSSDGTVMALAEGSDSGDVSAYRGFLCENRIFLHNSDTTRGSDSDIW